MNVLRGKVIEIHIENIAMHILIWFKISQFIALHKLQLIHSPMGRGGGQVHLCSFFFNEDTSKYFNEISISSKVIFSSI